MNITTTIPTLGKWSATFPIPAIGERVNVTMNGFGPSTVRGYFVESGWIGIQVECDVRPAWHIKQNSNRHAFPCVFGAEIRKIQ